MGQSLFIAIDLGTQSSKASIINLSGEFLCNFSENYANEILLKGTKHNVKKECDPQWFYQHVIDILISLLQQAKTYAINIKDIEGISITTFRNSVVLLDESYDSVFPLILWSDQRRAQNVPNLSWYWRIMFNIANLIYPIKSNLLDMQRCAALNVIAEMTTVGKNNVKYLSLLSGYITYKLTGTMVDSTANIIGYLPFNYRTKKWYSPFAWQFQALCVKSSWLIKLINPGHVIGSVSHDLLGHILSESANTKPYLNDLKLIAGTADKNCEMLGAGCYKNGQLHLSLGSAITLNVLSKEFIGPKPLYPAYPTFDEQLYTIEIMLEKGLVLLTEFINHYQDEILQRISTVDHNDSEANLVNSAEFNIVARVNEYVEINAITAQGISFNLHNTKVHTDFNACFNQPFTEQKHANIFHYYVAIIDAIVYEINRAVRQLAKRYGTKFNTMFVSGGGCRSRWLLQKIARQTNLTLIKAQSECAGVLGAAIMCAVGLDKFRNYEEAVFAMVKPGTIINVDD